ncbi:MAG: MSMEG_0572 family nitrogen starvation response protein [Vulcanimicrobiaceae bacterium]
MLVRAAAKPPEKVVTMPAVSMEAHKTGDFLVDYEEKVFEDVKASPGEKAIVTFHTVAFEGSIGLVNILQALRLLRKGFETTILLYGPGVTLGVQRGFPKLGDEAFPGALNFNNQLKKFMDEGGKVYCCRFALQALYGHGEASLIEGIRPISPLDVLDIQLIHRRENAYVLSTWTL